MDYILHLIILIEVYAILAASLDLIAGQTGMVSVAHAAFFGVGAYSSALTCLHYPNSFYLGMAVGIALSAAVSLLIAITSARLQDDYFTIATLGLQTIIFYLMNNLAVTRGPLGLPNIPRPKFFGLAIASHASYVSFYAIFAAASIFILHFVANSPFGGILRGIREDEILCQALGRNTFRVKVSAICVSSAIASVSGSLYAHYISFIDPTLFSVSESIFIISMVVVGGAGRQLGAIIGAALLILLPEVLRLIGITGPGSANIRQILYGCLLVSAIMFRPKGLVGRFKIGG